MAVTNLKIEDFESTIENNDIVILDFWAEWCGPCKQFSPIFEAVSEKHPDIVFAKVNVRNNKNWPGCSKCAPFQRWCSCVKNRRFLQPGHDSGKQPGRRHPTIVRFGHGKSPSGFGKSPAGKFLNFHPRNLC